MNTYAAHFVTMQRGKTVELFMSDVRSLYPNSGLSDNVIDYPSKVASLHWLFNHPHHNVTLQCHWSIE